MSFNGKCPTCNTTYRWVPVSECSDLKPGLYFARNSEFDEPDICSFIAIDSDGLADDFHYTHILFAGDCPVPWPPVDEGIVN